MRYGAKLMENNAKLKVFFVCHGNICRSPMAEFVLRRLVDAAGLSQNVDIASAATSDEEIGNPVYPLAKRTLAIHGIGCRDKVAQRITSEMYDDADLIVAMDRHNVANLDRLLGPDVDNKVRLLLDFLPVEHPKHSCDIADPWYTRDFETAYSDIVLGCKALLKYIESQIAAIN